MEMGSYLCVLNGGDIVEVLGVGDAEAPHAMGMTPFLEMTVEGTTTPVGMVACVEWVG